MANLCREISEASSSIKLGTINQTAGLSRHMLRLFLSENHSDVVFIVEGQRIPAHRCILAARNEYFQILLYGHFAESSQKEVELKVPFDAFKTVLWYIYSGQMCLLDMEEKTVLDILALANLYAITDLEVAIVGYLKQILMTLNSVFAIYKMALRFDLEDLKSSCLTFIDRNASGLLAHESINELPRELLQEILTRNSFLASEFDIFSAVRSWGRANPGVNFNPLLSCVRFPLLNDIELSKVWNSGIVSRKTLDDAVKERNASGGLPYRVWPDENVVSFKYGSMVIKGLWLITPTPPGRIFPYELEDTTASTPAVLAHYCNDEIVIQLGITTIINHIKFRLSGQYGFSYFLEVSGNRIQYERVADYTTCTCRNIQSLYFPTKQVTYIKIVGTGYHTLGIAALKASYTEKVQRQLNGFLAATIGIVAMKEYHSNLCNIKTFQLDQPYAIHAINLYFWYNPRPYEFEIEVSTDGTYWRRAAIKRNQTLSWQNVQLSPYPVGFIRLTSNLDVDDVPLIKFLPPC